ncbi:MAG: hypothetical protein NXI27_07020 [Alphaproteobacteria bacterium]|nr:hypothetical protein [Alphaproteobacteria bacterium]
MTIDKIKPANDVITEFLDTQTQDENLDPDTLLAITALRHDGKLTKTGLLRQLETLRKAAVDKSQDEGSVDD